MIKTTSCLQKKIQFEANFLTKKEDQLRIINEFCNRGYVIQSQTDVDVTLAKSLL